MEKCVYRVSPIGQSNTPGLLDDADELRKIVEPRPDPVADLRKLLAPITVRIHGIANLVVVVARRRLNHLLQGRELLHAEFLETDRVQLDLLGELRDVEHLFFRFANVAVDKVPMQKEVVLRQYRQRIPDLLLGDALLKLLQDPVVRRLDPEQEDLEPRFLGLVEDPGMPGDVNPGLDDKGFINLVLDDQIAELFASFQVCEEIVIADEHDVSGNRLQFVNDGFDRSFRVASLLPEWIETECAELAFERASPCRQDRVERVAAESHAVLGQIVAVPSQ